MKDPQNKILDTFLDEMLNQDRPKRSSEEILRNVQSVQKTLGYPVAAPEFELQSETDSAAELATKQSGQTLEPVATNSKGVPAAETKTFNWSPIFATAAAIAVVSAIGFAVLYKANSNQIANNNGDISGADVADLDSQRPDDQSNPGTPDEQPEIVRNPPVEQRPGNGTEDGTQPPEIAKRDDVPEDMDAIVLPGEFVRERTVNVAAKSSLDMSRQINQHLYDAWAAETTNKTAAAPLDLDIWVNRLASRLLGRPLNADELTEFSTVLAQNKSDELIRADLVKLLLDSPDFRSEFNQHWGRLLAWQMLGISPSMETSDADMLGTRELLTESLAQNKPLDETAYRLLSAVGSTASNEPEFNPATSYLVGLRKRLGTPQLSTAHISRTFLGQQSQCQQCHNSFGEGTVASTQQEFFQLHSFFAQLEISRSGEHFNVYNRNFLPLGRQGKVEAAFKYKDAAGNEFEAFPQFGQFKPETNGFVAKVDRRTELATNIASSNQFRETMVEHVWTSLLNMPLSGIDGNITEDMAELRKDIGEQFAANEFDVAWLVSSIVSSNAFAVQVASDEQLAANNPFLGDAPKFNVFYSRLENRRSAIQSLDIVARAYTSGNVEQAMSAGLLARIDNTLQDQRPQFIHPFLPTKESQWATTPAISRHLDLIAASEMNAEQKIQHLVQAALSRSASDDELRKATLILESSDDQRIALQDVWWSLLNSVDYKIPLNVR